MPVAGLALIIVVGQLATAADATAELATPLVVALAIAGAALAISRRRVRVEPWAAAAAVGVFAAFGAPVLLSGEATFTGYIKLDDTATWLALTDGVMEHGRSAAALPPSSYEATLELNLGKGYPVGAFLPLGVGAAVAGQDPAWVVQPYMSLLAAMLALGLAVVTGPFVGSPRGRALVALIAAQPALLFGYSLWGGVKEVAVAALLPLVAALGVASIPAARARSSEAGRRAVTRERRRRRPEGGGRREPCRRGRVTGDSLASATRALIPLAVAAAAVIAVVSVGGVVWLAPLLVPVAVAAARWIGPGAAVRWTGAFVVLAVALAVPALAVGGVVPPWARPLTSDGSLGNLLGPVSGLQVVGIWPSGDFRLDPELDLLSGLLIAVAIGAAIGGAALAIRARAWPLLAYAGGTLAACGAVVAVGSPWVDAKALAIASPCVLLLGAAGAMAASRAGNPVAGGLVLLAIAAGVLWSNVLAYREVTLAPRAQLAELAEIGGRIDGEGPTLMTEYQPYGVRHFLRDASPEGASELRRRQIPLRDGGTVRTGRYADTDELDPAALLAYRTLVLRRSPVQSRPPAPYTRVFRGEHYDVWQRAGAAPGSVLGHKGLGGGTAPAAVPRCAVVRRLARRAGPGGRLAAVARPAVTVLPLVRADRPPDWGPAGDGLNRVLPRGGGAIDGRVTVPAADRYEIWVGGSVRGRLDLLVDGRLVGSVRHRLNNSGQYILLGRARLARGSHDLTLRLAEPDLHPGSGGQPLAIGPLALSRGEAPEREVVRVAPRRARSLCGRSWDWIEALGA